MTAHARAAQRPASLGHLRDGYCCPYGLGQWEGRPHRYVYGDYGYRDGGNAPSTVTAPRPLVVDEARGAVGTQTPPTGFYDDIGDSNFDRPSFREGAPAASQDRAEKAAEDEAENHPTCQGREPREEAGKAPGLEADDAEPFCEMPADGDSPLRSLEDSLADWRHSAGQWIVQHLNAESDGLEETVAGELDWEAIAKQMQAQESPVGVDSPADAGGRTDEAPRDVNQEEDVEGTGGDWFRPRREPGTVPPVQPPKSDGEETSQGPGRLREWCGQLWGAIRGAARKFSQRLEQLSEEVSAAPTTTDSEDAVELVEPRIEATRPPLPDYFLPAFGSPWDGEL